MRTVSVVKGKDRENKAKEKRGDDENGNTKAITSLTDVVLL